MPRRKGLQGFIREGAEQRCLAQRAVAAGHAAAAAAVVLCCGPGEQASNRAPPPSPCAHSKPSYPVYRSHTVALIREYPLVGPRRRQLVIFVAAPGAVARGVGVAGAARLTRGVVLATPPLESGGQTRAFVSVQRPGVLRHVQRGRFNMQLRWQPSWSAAVLQLRRPSKPQARGPQNPPGGPPLT